MEATLWSEQCLRTARLSVEVAGLRLRNPTMLASGVLGYSSASLKRVEEGGAGAVVTKSVGLKPRKGYANPTVFQADCGLINAMGLPNPGIEEFTSEIREAKLELNVPLVVSVYGYNVREYAAVASKAADAGADAVELNVSCPHVKDTGAEIGRSPRLLSDVVAGVKGAVDCPVLVKLSPNVSDIGELAESAAKAGADALTVMNTVRALAIDSETMMPVLSNSVGGLSGPAVKPIALRNVYEVYKRVKLPIIGCGGVRSWRDAAEFLLAGASAVQIGTAVATEGLDVFGAVARGLDSYLREKGFGSVKDIVGLSHRN